MVKQTKTNAMRFLERQKVAYTVQEYETADGAIDGLAVARKTGRDPAMVYKTLVCRGASGAVLVFCVPVDDELCLKRAARAAGEKSVAMLPQKEITPTTGYVRGGVSPFAMKKAYPTFLDIKARQQPKILVSGGRIGLQIELAPEALVEAASAVWME